MIISASRRTDIPAFFSDWFIKRINEGYVCVRNPMNPHQISKICLSPDVVDCIVFWSKNPEPILEKLTFLQDYMYYFQFTLNPYDKDVETNLPALHTRIDTFQTLSHRIGKDRVIWRYDPVIVNDTYSVDWHVKNFQYLAERLCPYTEKVTISFVDSYAKISRVLKEKNIRELSCSQKNSIAGYFAEIAHSHHLTIDTCAEDIDLSLYGIAHARCIDDRLISKLLGCSLDVKKDKNQRVECGCVTGIDIGLYNTCQNGCIYCYANHSCAARRQNLRAYETASPLLCSHITEADKITQRKVESYKNMQLRL